MSGSQPDDSINLAEATILRLSDSISQYAASAINTVAIPSFQGLPNEDVHEFLRKFKLATITFAPELRCMALNRAFSGAAHVWAKTIKNMISNGDWKGVKQAMINRFAAPNREMRYREKLAQMKYESSKETLTSYIEGFVNCYRKAYKEPSDNDIIMALKVNLPHPIIRSLNMLSDNWTDANSLESLYSLIRRLEYKILPYEQEDEAGGKKLDIQSLSKLLSELKESMQIVKAAKQEEKAPTEAIAVIQDQKFTGPQYRERRPQQGQSPQFRRNNWNSNRYGPDRRYKYRREAFRETNDQYHAPARMLPALEENKAANNREILSSYEKMYGKLPGPCQICRGDHFNRHCPYKDLN